MNTFSYYRNDTNSSLFPVITCIQDVLPYIEDKSEIRVIEKNGYKYIDYVISTGNTFDNNIALECRGLIFDSEGSLIRRPMHKFFNRQEEVSFNESRRTEEFSLCVKHDGSMICPFIHEGKVRFGTRAGITEVSIKAEEELTNPGLRSLLREMIQIGLSPSFEYTSPNNRIVMEYQKPELTLLCVRDLYTGIYARPAELNFWSNILSKHGVNPWESISPDNLSCVQHWKHAEGVVLWYSNGHAEKLKADEYITLHKLRDEIMNEKDVIRIILENKLDDIISKIAQKDKERILKYRDELMNSLYGWGMRIKVCLLSVCSASRKEQALFINKNLSEVSSAAFSVLDGNDPTQAMIEFVLRNATTQVKLDQIRNIIDCTY